MTAPATLPPGDEVPDQEALYFELSAVALVAGGFAAVLAPVLGGILAAYAAGVTGAALSELAARMLRALTWPPMAPALRVVARRAVELGEDRTVRAHPDLPLDFPAPMIMRAPELGLIDSVAKDHLDTAASLARTLPMTTKAHALAVMGKANRARVGAEGAARAVANRGINHGTAAMVRRMGLRLIWVTERDACLHCLALAGYAVEPGDHFPVLTYADRPLDVAPVPYPPLHPNCRCQVRPYGGPAGAPPYDRSRVDAAARLRAEAQRSVVYQWADTSQAAGIRAAARLLERGTVLADSVERRAARRLVAVRRRTVRK